MFDAENAKAAVSKGACVLHVLRDTLVGFEVDVADFKANMLADIFYQNSMGGRRVLFAAGKIDDFGYVEEAPDRTSFAEHLSIFSGSRSTLLGQFRFNTGGEAVEPSDYAEWCRRARDKFGELPKHRELLKLRESNRERYLEFANELLEWPERCLVAWMEESAQRGEAERPLFRYYLTRNRNLYAVRDQGHQRELFSLHWAELAEESLPARDNPFSGVH